MPEWTSEEVAYRFGEAARTAQRLPPVRVQGYFNLWPAFAREEWESYAEPERALRFPPTPRDIERMLEVMGWVQWLEVEQRHLVWMRAQRYRWSEIATRFGCAARTSQRRWDTAIGVVTTCLRDEVDRS